jgi:hypothetical protein
MYSAGANLAIANHLGLVELVVVVVVLQAVAP